VALWGRPGVEMPGLRLRWLKRRTRRRPRGRKKSLAEPRFDPRHQPDPPSGASGEGEHLYPEWDYQRRAYRRDWCRITESEPNRAKRGATDPAVQTLARRVRRQFESLRQVTVWNRNLESGDEVDIDAFVDAVGDARRFGSRSSRLYRRREQRLRDLSVAVLVDTSRSTSAWVGEHRVIDVARQSMIVLAEALDAVGDAFALYGFSSDSRLRVRCQRLKAFGEPYDRRIRGNLGVIEPADYTRMGAAIRHVGSQLERRTSAQKVVLVLTDGRPHDPTDRYEGRYALEDTRRALQELRVLGVHCFGLTIDQRGRDYLPYLFGPGHYAVFSQPQALPTVLPRLYARITALNG
jgi:nitric oxide reductase NorD protein